MRNASSPTTDIYIIENQMTRHKCHDAQANPLLREPRESQDEETKTLLPLVPLEQLDLTSVDSWPCRTGKRTYNFVIYQL